MPRYANGRAPLAALVEFDTGGGQHWGPAATRARWYEARQRIYNRTLVWLSVTPGWNVFRPYDQQVIGRRDACASGNCAGAASPGWSSHGLTWQHWKFTGGAWVDAAALDIGDYWRVPWAVFKEECEAAGFLVGAITPDVAGIFEGWHIIDLAPWDAFAGGGATPFDPEEDDMYNDEDRKRDNAIKAALLDGRPQSGMAVGALDLVLEASTDVKNRVRGTLPWDNFQEIARRFDVLQTAVLANDPGSPVSHDDFKQVVEESEARLRETFQQQFESFGVAIRAEILASLGNVKVEAGITPEEVQAAAAAAIDDALKRIGVQITVAPAT